MHNIKQEVTDAIEHLPDTADFDDIVALVKKMRQLEKRSVQPTGHSSRTRPVSFLNAANKYSGRIKDAPPDLSSSETYFEGFGE